MTVLDCLSYTMHYRIKMIIIMECQEKCKLTRIMFYNILCNLFARWHKFVFLFHSMSALWLLILMLNYKNNDKNVVSFTRNMIFLTIRQIKKTASFSVFFIKQAFCSSLIHMINGTWSCDSSVEPNLSSSIYYIGGTVNAVVCAVSFFQRIKINNRKQQWRNPVKWTRFR